MEVSWLHIRMKPPTDAQLELDCLVTVYNEPWIHNPQTRVMTFKKETTRKGDKYYWQLPSGIKCPSTWEITHWMPMIPPAND